MNSRGKRMVQEDELKYLQELKEAHSDPSAEWGGGGSSLEAGAGIDITEGVLSVDYGAGLTVDDGVLVVDASTVAMKSELATVATTGSYSDLTGTPTIMPVIELTYGTPATQEQIATFEVGATALIDFYGTKNVYYCNRSDSDYWYFNRVKPDFGTVEQWGIPTSQLIIPIIMVYKSNGELSISNNGVGNTYYDPETMKLTSKNYVSTVIGGGVMKTYPLLSSDFSIVGSTAYCNNDKINYYIAYMAIDAYKKGWSSFNIQVGGQYNTEPLNIAFSTTISGNDVIFEVTGGAVNNLGSWFTYNTAAEGITATSSVFNEYLEYFYTTYVIAQEQQYLKELDATAATKVGLIKTMDPQFIPVDGTSITVDSNGKLAATGGSSSGKYMHKVQIRCKASSTSLVFDDFVVTNSATAYTSAEDYLTDQGYTITTTSDNLTNYLTCMHSGGMVSIAVMSGVAYRADISIDASGDIVKQNSWSLVSDTVGITDTVIAL